MMDMPPHSARGPRDMGPLKIAGNNQVVPGAPLSARRNPLLVRDDVGKSKPSCYTLPHSQFSYGRPGNLDVEGAREVSMNWVSHIPSQEPGGAAPDFVGFNKKAACSKITTAKDLKHFRREHDVETPRSYSQGRPATTREDFGKRTRRAGDDLPIPPGFTHGRKIRPSTPIRDVVSYRFAEHHERELNRFYNDFSEMQEAARTQIRKIPLTTASRGHASAARKALLEQDESKDLFKLGKFKKCGSKIDNGRKKSTSYPWGEDFEQAQAEEHRMPADFTEPEFGTGRRGDDGSFDDAHMHM